MKLAIEAAEAAKIVLFSMGAAIVYGLLHDQVTAHLCVEYFSIAHPPLIASTSPFVLALGWGIIATWWVGLPLGLGLVAAARLGPAPRFGLADVRRPIVMLMFASAAAAVVSGAAGAIAVAAGFAEPPYGWAENIPPAKHIAFTADAWAHQASYSVGIIGGLFVIGRTVWRRWRGGRPEVPARSVA